jgi:acyl-CoA hydrolase
MDPKPVSESRTTLAHWMSILDANSARHVHGGTVLKMCDEAAGLAAVKHSRQRVVTAGVDRVNFLVPIHIGELVTFTASVNAVWRTSMEVGVRVEAENPLTGEVRHTNTAYFTMVALDPAGNPTAVPPLIATNAAEERRMREAELRRTNRLDERAQILDHRAPASS